MLSAATGHKQQRPAFSGSQFCGFEFSGKFDVQSATHTYTLFILLSCILYISLLQLQSSTRLPIQEIFVSYIVEQGRSFLSQCCICHFHEIFPPDFKSEQIKRTIGKFLTFFCQSVRLLFLL